MVEKDYDLQFNKHGCTILDANNLVIAKVKMLRNHLFALELNYDEPYYHASIIVDDIWLWQMKLVHLNLCSIKYLASKNLMTSLPFINVFDKVCENCLLGK